MANIKDVAKRAGLSPSCISKYLKNADSVRDDTRKKIEAAIKALNYVPSSIARSLRTRKTYTVKIILPSIINPFFAGVFELLQRKLDTLGYSSVLQVFDGERELTQNDFQGLDGIIVCFANKDESVLKIHSFSSQMSIPFVCIHWYEVSDKFGTIVFDVEDGIRQTTRHLLDTGCKNIAYVDGSDDSQICRARHRCFIDIVPEAMRSHIFQKECSLEWGYHAASRMIVTGRLPDGVVCGNDIIAAGLIRRLHAENIRVPDEVSVVGFDNTAISEICSPAISSFAIPVRDISEAAGDMLIASIAGTDMKSTSFKGYLVSRESTKRG